MQWSAHKLVCKKLHPKDAPVPGDWARQRALVASVPTFVKLAGLTFDKVRLRNFVEERMHEDASTLQVLGVDPPSQCIRLQPVPLLATT